MNKSFDLEKHLAEITKHIRENMTKSVGRARRAKLDPVKASEERPTVPTGQRVELDDLEEEDE